MDKEEGGKEGRNELTEEAASSLVNEARTDA